MNKKNFFTTGLKIIAKFILAGLAVIAFIVLFKNRNDILATSLSMVISFIVGGMAMAISFAKELKSIIKENTSLKKQLKKAKKEISEFNETLEKIPVTSLVDFNEASNEKTA